MIIDSGHVALARQQHLKATNSLDAHTEELTQLKVMVSNLSMDNRMFEY